MLALDDVLGLSVNLQLRNDSFDHVGFVVAGLGWEGDRIHGAVFELNLERLVAHFHWLVLEVRARDLAVPSVFQLLIDASILNIVEAHLKSIAVAGADGELRFHQHAGPLILKIGQGCESA